MIQATKVAHRTVKVRDLDIFFREAGPKDAPAILLLHGFPTSSQMFRNLIPALAGRYHVLAPDYPGFGHSSMPPRDEFAYTFDNLAGVVEEFTEILGLDNIGLFDRSKPLPNGGHLEQADGTAWMAFYCTTLLAMALELARDNPATEDVASKFFEHFVAIADAMNTLGGTGLWDEQDGFYYDRLHTNGHVVPTRIRSLVGLIPLVAVEVLDDEVIERLPGFRKRLQWFLENRKDLGQHIAYMEAEGACRAGRRLLAIPSRARLERVLRYLLDENELLSPFGVRSLSRFHKDNPYVCWTGGQENRVAYVPGDSDSGMFGGNSNWRGPVWFPVNYLLIEALERYHHFYGDSLRVECPTSSGRWMNLAEVALELGARLTKLFLPDAQGRRPCHGNERRFADDPHWKDLLLFHEYFHGDNGCGVGASHQTGWTALVTRLLEMAPSTRATPAQKIRRCEQA